jgi:uncharacterized lipoprotein YbaY
VEEPTEEGVVTAEEAVAEEATPEPESTIAPAEPLSVATTQGVPATPLEEGEYLLVLGTLVLPTDDDLPTGAVARAQVLDVSTSPFTLVTEQSVDAGAVAPPIPFDLAVPVDDATDLGAYAIDARIVVDGEVRWRAGGLTPLLGADGPRTDLVVELEAAESGLVEPSFATPGPRPTATATPVATLAPLDTPTTAVVPTEPPAAFPDATSTTEPLPAAPAAASATEPAPSAAGTLPAGQVTGVVRSASADLLPRGATVTAQLRKGAGATAEVVAEAIESVASAGGPVEFVLPYGAGVIEEDDAYSVAVRVTLNGAPLWLTGRGFPVLTQGAPSTVEVEIR